MTLIKSIFFKEKNGDGNVCPTGFTSYAGSRCQDVNECTLFSDICGKHGLW